MADEGYGDLNPGNEYIQYAPPPPPPAWENQMGSGQGAPVVPPEAPPAAASGAVSYSDPRQMALALMQQGLTGEQVAAQVNGRFPGAVTWRADRNFLDFPQTNSYIHQRDAGGWAGDWEIVERGPEGGGSGFADPATLAALNGIGPFNYEGGRQQTFAPTTPAYVPERFTAPDAFVAPTLSETNDPGYKFRLATTQDAVESSAAARGNLLSTGTLAEVTQRVGDQASAEYANVYSRAFGEYKQAFDQSFQANDLNNKYGLASNINSFNQEYQTAQLNNASQNTDFNQQLQRSQTNYDYLYKLANLGAPTVGESFS